MKTKAFILFFSAMISFAANGFTNNQNTMEMQHNEITGAMHFDPMILSGTSDSDFQKNSNAGSSTQAVSFKSEGLVLKGKLHLPAGFSAEKTYKGVVVTGSWTTVKEQMPDLYAQKLAERGFVALTFDFRNYGESEGQPRNYESARMKAQDIVHASTYLKSLPFIEGEHLGGLALCASAGYMSLALTEGAPLQAVNFVAPWLHNRELVEMIYGGAEGVHAKIQLAEKAKQRFAMEGEVEYVPAISTSNPQAAMYGEWDYYLNPQRGAIQEWGNQFAVMAWEEWLTFDPIKLGALISTPIQIIHSQTAAVPQGAEAFFKQLRGEKNIIWVPEASQFDFYDQEPYTTNAADNAARWFNDQLQ